MSKVGINGFGRIGRLVFRRLLEMRVTVVAVNDLTSPKMLAHLLKYDSAQGRFAGTVDFGADCLIVNGAVVKVYAVKDPREIPWGEGGVEVVVESTGFFTDPAKAVGHLNGGARKVLVSAPFTGDADGFKTIVFGVNDDTLDGSETVVSGASCTTNCLAPMAKALDDAFGIQSGFMTTIHAYTNDQALVDAAHPKGDMRRSRAAACNVIPNSTGAAKAIGLVVPSLKGKLDGGAQRVPVVTGSLTELVAVVGRSTTVDEVNRVMAAAASGNDSFGYNVDEIVSSDVVGITQGSLFDATQTKANGSLVKVVAWYDNESSYVAQLCRTLAKL